MPTLGPLDGEINTSEDLKEFKRLHDTLPNNPLNIDPEEWARYVREHKCEALFAQVTAGWPDL